MVDLVVMRFAFLLKLFICVLVFVLTEILVFVLVFALTEDLIVLFREPEVHTEILVFQMVDLVFMMLEII